MLSDTVPSVKPTCLISKFVLRWWLDRRLNHDVLSIAAGLALQKYKALGVGFPRGKNGVDEASAREPPIYEICSGAAPDAACKTADLPTPDLRTNLIRVSLRLQKEDYAHLHVGSQHEGFWLYISTYE